jgi:hypothetical protein
MTVFWKFSNFLKTKTMSCVCLSSVFQAPTLSCEVWLYSQSAMIQTLKSVIAFGSRNCSHYKIPDFDNKINDAICWIF